MATNCKQLKTLTLAYLFYLPFAMGEETYPTGYSQIVIDTVQIIIYQLDLINKRMQNQYFPISTLERGTQLMVQVMKHCAAETYEKCQDTVLPNVKPGFLRKQLAQCAPQEGSQLEYLMEMTKNVIFPGTFKWQSPKFFGYYPCAINVTNVFADMFVALNQTPNFSFAVSPAFTELQNIVVDWCAKALRLPQKFLLKNSGGGILNNCASQSIFSSVHAAFFKKMKQLDIQGNNPDVLKFVGYFGHGSHISSQKGLMLKNIYYRRPIPYKYNSEILNYELDIQYFEEKVEEDVRNGLIPFWFGFSYGNTFSAAIDINQRAIQICKKHKMWINVDAAYLGSTWICQKYRAPLHLLQEFDSIDINFSKILLNGMGTSLFYVADKKVLTQSLGNSQFSFYKNSFTGRSDVVDYKDWIIGLGRRNNALKIYYTFVYYGLNKIRRTVQSHQEKTQYLISLIKQHPALLKLHTVQYAIVTFKILGKNGEPSNQITKIVTTKVNNILEGFSSPGEYSGESVVRIVVGNFHTQNYHIKSYFQAIIKVTKETVDTV